MKCKVISQIMHAYVCIHAWVHVICVDMWVFVFFCTLPFRQQCGFPDVVTISRVRYQPQAFAEKHFKDLIWILRANTGSLKAKQWHHKSRSRGKFGEEKTSLGALIWKYSQSGIGTWKGRPQLPGEIWFPSLLPTFLVAVLRYRTKQLKEGSICCGLQCKTIHPTMQRETWGQGQRGNGSHRICQEAESEQEVRLQCKASRPAPSNSFPLGRL